MRTLGSPRLKTFLENGWEDQIITNKVIRGDPGMSVYSFPKLVQYVARLAYSNRDHVLLFRGQSQDYTNQLGHTTIHPKIFRPRQQGELLPWMEVVQRRYRRLRRAEQFLVREWRNANLPDLRRIERYKNLRWTILQHYEVCPTPLLDVTHSLRVAVSFAAERASNHSVMLYVFAVPQISGAITASAEAELQILRLSSICPPTATRPHFQEGYLLGNYPDIQSPEEKEQYELYEVDFGRRLLCKFRLNLDHFWRDDFPQVSHDALYPDARRDPFLEISERIMNQLGPEN